MQPFKDALLSALLTPLCPARGLPIHIHCTTPNSHYDVRPQTFLPLYLDAKSLLCCQWIDAVYALWASWTAAGVVGFAFCAALTAQLQCLLLPLSATSVRQFVTGASRRQLVAF